MKKIQKFQSSMAINLIGAIVMMLLLFGILASTFGFMSFSRVIKNEYAVSTYHMADTAASIVNGDHLDDYLAGELTEEYLRTRNALDGFCHKMHVSIIYVIDVDTSDYGRFLSVFNLVDNSVDNSSYTAWELGHPRETTNDEYRQKYIALYEQGSLFETVYRNKPTDGQHPHITTMVPVKNSSGETAGLLCIQRPIRELKNARQPYLTNIAISTVLLAILASLFLSAFIRKHVVRPIEKTSAEAIRFAKESTKGEPLSSISRYTEISDLAHSIDKMETDMVNYIDNLTDITAEQERIGTELQMAAQIQDGMLPGTFPPFPDRKEFSLYAVMDPAREVGGDFYDFFLIDDDHLCLVMADVSGKGIPASLFMMASMIIIRSCAMLGRGAAEILEKTNEALCTNNKMEMFVTVWIGILELSTGKLAAANAGHEYPALRRQGGSFELFKDKHGFVIGGMPGLSYKEYELQLNPGDELFLYTDGVPEAMNAKGELFGTERMVEALNRVSDSDPEAVLAGVRLGVDDFVRDAEQFDDLTMLGLRYDGKRAE